jgi:hypothetical protein
MRKTAQASYFNVMTQVEQKQKPRPMKKLIIYALITLVGWNYYQKNNVSAEEESQTLETVASQPAENFSCDGRQYCSQMQSRAEAEYFLSHCPDMKMDGDHDGIPCENDSRF